MMKCFQSLIGVFVCVAATTVVASAQSAPSFAPPSAFAAPGASAATAGDLNRDGRVDVVTANGLAAGDHGVSVLLGNGDGSFASARTFVTGSDPSSVAVCDVNGDGKLDVVAANASVDSLSVLLGNGDGTLQSARTILVAGSPTSLSVANLDADGKADLVVVVQTGTGTYLDAVFMSNGDGTFRETDTPGPFGAVVSDFNGDGRPDLCVYGLAASPEAAIRFGNGDGTFTDSALPFTLDVPFEATLAVAGDFNGDGKTDLYGEFVSCGCTRAGLVFSSYTALGNGDGTFHVSSTGLANLGVGGNDLLTGDFNRDGKLDVAGIFPGPIAARQQQPSTANTLRVIYGAGDGTFLGAANGVRIEFPAGSSTGQYSGPPIVSADFDGNGAPDFAWASGSDVDVIRNANGNPPLLAGLRVDAAFPEGGAGDVTATVTIGDPAPAGGATVALTSSTPAAILPPGASATIPAGATSATFRIGTAAVAAPVLTTVGASWNGVRQSATFTLEPAASVASVAVTPASVVGLFGGLNGPVANDATGQLTLASAAPDGGASISLVSSNPAIVSVPSSASIAPGSATVTFAVHVLTNVAANTSVTISATYRSATRNGSITVLAATDTVQVTKAEYTVRGGQWRIEARSSNASATMWALTPAGVYIGALAPQGGGVYKGQGTLPGPFTTVVIQSSKGGKATSAVAQK